MFASHWRLGDTGLNWNETFTCAKPAFSKAHGIDNKADPIMVFQIDRMVVNDEFLVPEAIAIAEPLMLSDLKKIYQYEIVQHYSEISDSKLKRGTAN